MNELHELRGMLCKELKEYGTKELTAGSLDTIDKLCHAIKNLDKVIDSSDEGYSGYYPGRSYRDYGRSYRRDSMGRYSRDGGFAEDLRELMKEAPSEEVRAKIRKLADQIEGM